MKDNKNLQSAPEIEIPAQTKLNQKNKEIIRERGCIVYFSSQSLGFDIVTHFPDTYLHTLPDEAVGLCLLLPLWKGGDGHLV